MLRLLHIRFLHHVTAARLRIPSTATANTPPHFLPRPFPQPFSHISLAPNDSSSLTVHFLKKSCGLSSEAALSVATKIHLKNTKNPHSVLALLKYFGFSKPDIGRLITRRPDLLLARPDKTLQPKLEFYRGIGLSGAALAKLLSGIPHLLLRSLEKRLLPNFHLLKSMLDTNENVISAVRNSPRLLVSDLPKVLLPKIHSLMNYGMPPAVIFTLLTTHPKSLIEKANRFEEIFDVIKDLGISPSSTMYAHAFGVLSKLPKTTVKRRLENYLSLGWSEEQVFRAFAKHPYCMSASDDKIRKNMEFFAAKLKWGPDYVSANPVLLSLSFKKRIVPRCLVLGMLTSKGLVKHGVKARHLMMAEKKFLEDYVIKYQVEVPEVVDAMEGNELGLLVLEMGNLGVDGNKHLDAA
ncbi:uncharacterized protein [Elaeis guineensis]|uniref:Uncharacterized protein LOC105061347 n=1 Tax=Elaeis guineensis var. tenera TaxID=51953 RepID=A0A6I9SIF7_ELAGV|nr:uncharacterized protein LOC105061347 [Elaeis guineensis]XP_010943662.1 uncharacterized protein LOC105061347 [Elaeis guineensis]